MEKNSGKTIPQLFGYNLKKIRKERNMTQDELSEKLGISQKHLSTIETGDHFASAQLMEKIISEFNIPISELFVSDENSSNQFFNMYESICNHIDLKLEEFYRKLKHP